MTGSDEASENSLNIAGGSAAISTVFDAMRAEDIINAMGDAISIQAPDFRILYQNQAHKKIIGEHAGQYCYEAYEKKDAVCQGCPVELSFRDGRIHTAQRNAPAEHGTIYVDVTASPLKDEAGNVIAVIEAVREVTDRKIAEDRLSRNHDTQTAVNRLLQLSLDDMPLETVLDQALRIILSIPWLTLESKGAIFLADDSASHLIMKAWHGLDASIMGKCSTVRFGSCLCGRAASGQEIEFSDTLDSRHEIHYEGMEPHGHYCVPILLQGKTLGVIALYLSEGHVRDSREEGFLSAIANTLSGIIQRKRTEEEKEKIKSQLFQSQKMEAIGMLAGGIAHDFNNLLTAIQGYTDLSMMTLQDADPLYRNMKEVRLAASRAANLTKQMLLFSRKQPMELVPLNINKTIENITKMLSRLIGEDIEIRLRLQPGLWTVMADEGNMEQILMNLSVNARDVMPAGGSITISTENIILDEEYSRCLNEARPGRFARLTIEDTGSGMDAETLQHIFEPFFSTKTVGKGTGLGLSVVYGIVRQHEGWINVYSEPGYGTTFKVYIPATSIEAQPAGRESFSIEQFRGNNERILLVEDDDAVRRVTKEVLQESGYVIFAASTASEAMELFAKEKGCFDLVMSDVVMPGGSGIELIAELLALKPSLQVLLCSGYSDEKSQLNLIRENRFSFIQKPYSIAKLLDAIKKILNS